MDETDFLVRMAKGVALEEKLRAARERLGHDVSVQAEVIGPGTQKYKYGLKHVAIRVFNVLNVDIYRLLDHPAVLAELAEMGQEGVPLLGTLVLNHSVDELVAFSEGECAETAGATGRLRPSAAHRGVRRRHRRAAQLQSDQPEVLARACYELHTARTGTALLSISMLKAT